MRDPDDLFQALARSAFRRRQKLGAADLAYLRGRGMDTVLRHAGEMIAARLAPADPPNDGRQTPMRGHPVFVAQHATGACCRGCLAKWHGIPKGRELTDDERAYVVRVLERWMREADAAAPPLPVASDGAAGDRVGKAGGSKRARTDAGSQPATEQAEDDDPQIGLGL